MFIRLPACLLTACLGVLAASPAAAITAPDRFDILRVDIRANDIAFDTLRNSILATAPSAAGVGLGNSLVRVDPATGAISGALFVGSEPGAIALSGDSSTAYIGLNGSPAVRKVDLNTHTVGALTALGSSPFFGFLYAEDIAVKPDDANTFVVSLRREGVSPRHGGVAAFNASGRLPNMTQDHTGSNRIEFSADPNVLFGLNNETTEFGLRTISLDANGVRETTVAGSAGGGFSTDFSVSDGLIYFSNGQVMDPDLGFPVGRFLANAQGGLSLLTPSTEGIAYGIASSFGSGASTLILYDQSTYVPFGTYDLGGIRGDLRALEVLSDGRLALLTSSSFFGEEGALYLLTPVPEPATWLSLSIGLVLLAAARRVPATKRR